MQVRTKRGKRGDDSRTPRTPGRLRLARSNTEAVLAVRALAGGSGQSAEASRINGPRIGAGLVEQRVDADCDADATWRSDELLTVHGAARVLNVTASWIYEHTRNAAGDRLPFLKLGKYLRFDPTDLRAYIDAKRDATRRQPRRR